MAVNRRSWIRQGLAELDASFADRFWTEPFREMIPPGDIDLDAFAKEGFTELSDRIEDLKGGYENNPHFFGAYDDWRHDQNVEAWVNEIERGIYQREDELWALQDEIEISDLVESIRPRNAVLVKEHIGSKKSNSEELWTENKKNKLKSADNEAYKVISYLVGPVARILDPANVLHKYLRNSNPSIRSSGSLAERVGALITNTLIEIGRRTKMYGVSEVDIWDYYESMVEPEREAFTELYITASRDELRNEFGEDYIEFVIESKRKELMEIVEIIGRYYPGVHDYISWKRVAEADSKPLEEELEESTLPGIRGQRYVNKPVYRGNGKPEQVSFQIRPAAPNQQRETISAPDIMTFATDSIGLPVMQKPQGYGKDKK